MLFHIWKNKEQLGWTREKYGTTEVWKAIEFWTKIEAPKAMQ